MANPLPANSYKNNHEIIKQSLTALMKNSIYFLTSLCMLMIYAILWQYDPLTIGLSIFIGLIILVLPGKNFLVPKWFLPLGIFFTIQSFTLFITPLPIYSLKLVISNWVALLFSLFVINSLKRGWKIETWENAIISMTLIISLIELYYAARWFTDWVNFSYPEISLPPIGYRSSGLVLFHPNEFAGFLNLVIPISLIRFLRSNRSHRFVWSIILIVFVLAEYFASSRGGTIGLVIGIGITIAILQIFHIKSKDNFQKKIQISDRTPSKKGIIALITGIIMVGLTSIVMFSQFKATPHGSLDDRIKLLSFASQMFLDSPIVGKGPGSFGVLFSGYAQVPPGESPSHAHNLIAQIAGEAGGLGLLLFAWVLLIFYRGSSVYWKSLIIKKTGPNRLAAYMGIFAALLTHHLIDYIFNFYYSLLILTLLVLLFFRIPGSTWSISKTKVVLVCCFLVIACASAAGWALRGDAEYRDGIAAFQKGELAKSRDNLCRASAINIHNTYLAFQCSLVNANLAYQSNDLNSLELSLNYQKNGLNKDPYWPVNWANLASYEWEFGNKPAAIMNMQRAVEMAPENPIFLLNLGRMEEKTGNTSEAVELYLRALDSDENLCNSTFFITDETRRKLIEHSDNCMKSNQPASIDALQEAIKTDPRNMPDYISLATLQMQSGYDAEALKTIQTALFIQETRDALFVKYKLFKKMSNEKDALQSLEQLTGFIRSQNYSSHYYSTVYHRPTFQSDLSPYLITGGITAEIQASLEEYRDYVLQVGDYKKEFMVTQLLTRETTR